MAVVCMSCLVILRHCIAGKFCQLPVEVWQVIEKLNARVPINAQMCVIYAKNTKGRKLFRTYASQGCTTVRASNITHDDSTILHT